MKLDEQNLYMDSPPPIVSINEVSNFLIDNWQIDGEVKYIASEKDAIYKVEASSEEAYIFRIFNIAESEQRIYDQCNVLECLAEVNPDLPIPRLVRSLNSQTVINIATPQGANGTYLSTCLPGKRLIDISVERYPLEEIGHKFGSLVKSLERCNTENNGTGILWDIRNWGMLDSLLRYYQGCQDDNLILNEYRYISDNIIPYLDQHHIQRLHNDFNPYNILIDDATPDLKVSGILDFGDMTVGPKIVDIAVASSYFIYPSDPQLNDLIRFYRGFIRDQEPDCINDCDMLYELIKARFIMTLLITQARAKRWPENSDYILKNAPRSLEGLRQMRSISSTQFQTLIKEGLRHGN